MLWSNAPWIWLAVVGIALIVEWLTESLVSIWFVIGGIAAMIASVCDAAFTEQIVIFLIISSLCLLCMRPLTRHLYATHKQEPTNSDRIIGQEGRVVSEICNLDCRGSVMVMGQTWSARSSSGENIPEGTTVVVNKIEGTNAFVEERSK